MIVLFPTGTAGGPNGRSGQQAGPQKDVGRRVFGSNLHNVPWDIGGCTSEMETMILTSSRITNPQQRKEQ